jgi:hypothetical protein
MTAAVERLGMPYRRFIRQALERALRGVQRSIPAIRGAGAGEAHASRVDERRRLPA